jgi:hypothetical protein
VSQEFQPYLDQVTRHVERDPGLVFEIQSELRTHLECAADEFESQGFSRQHAVEESLKAFGDPAQLALEFKATYGKRPVVGQSLRFIALWLAFPLAFLAVQLAWTGIREAWWRESSGWHAAKSIVQQIKSEREPPATFLPDQEPAYRKACWTFLAAAGSGDPRSLSGPQAPYLELEPINGAAQSRIRGIDDAMQGALACRLKYLPTDIPGPLPSFEPWRMDSPYNSAAGWELRRRSKAELLSRPGYLYALAEAHKSPFPQEKLALALAGPPLSDGTGPFWQARLASGAPFGFGEMVSRYGARFGAQGLTLTTVCADHYIRLAEEKADAGDILGAQKLLDDTDKLVARHMAELPPTKAILPLAVYRFIYLHDMREGILADKAGPGPDPAALTALAHELKPFQSDMYLPGVKPRATPIPPGGWAQLCGWASLVNNLLVIALACLTLVLAGVWINWAVAVLLVNGQIPAHFAPGLLPKPLARGVLPAGLVIWVALALFYAGVFANPIMRFDAPAWTSYPLIILLTVTGYAFLCAFTCRRHVQKRGRALGISEADLRKGRAFGTYTFCITLVIIGILASFKSLSAAPVGLSVALAVGGYCAWAAIRSFAGLDSDRRILTFIQIRSLRLSLGLAVACLSVVCLALSGLECVTAWAAWKSDALNQPVSEEFKREILDLLARNVK